MQTMEELEEEKRKAQTHFVVTGDYTWLAEVSYKIKKLQEKEDEQK